VEGLAAAWIAAMPAYFLISARRSLPVLQVRPGDFVGALAPVSVAAMLMALGVALLDRSLPPMPDLPRLAALVLAGGALYLALLLLIARASFAEFVAVVRNRAPAV
jgi:hypothetical protein